MDRLTSCFLVLLRSFSQSVLLRLHWEIGEGFSQSWCRGPESWVWGCVLGACLCVGCANVQGWAWDMGMPIVSWANAKGGPSSTSLSPKPGSFSQGVRYCFLSWGVKMQDTVCSWYAGQENLYILAFSEGNSLVHSQQRTAAEHTDTLKCLSEM